MSTRTITLNIKRAGFGGVADPSETAEAFVMDNPELVKDMKRGLAVDQSDVDNALRNSWETTLLLFRSYKGGYRSFRATLYKELRAYGLIVKKGIILDEGRTLKLK